MIRMILLIGTVAAIAPSNLVRAEREAPNILFAIADDWGAHAGAYGTPWVSTPAFDRVAAQGLLFTQAHTPTPKCAPSRAALLTGRNPWQLGAAANHVCYFPPEYGTWPEVLQARGWFVGHTQKGWGPGVAKDADGNPRRMTGRAFNEFTAPRPVPGVSASDYARNFEAFLDAVPSGARWCFWFGALEPHRGYAFRSGAARRTPGDIDHVPAFWPDTETVRHDMLDYAREVEHFDAHLGRMLESLEQRGLLRNTLVIVTSDHGMPAPRVKGNLYPAATRVPMAIMWPDGIRTPGRVIDDFVSLIDLAPTILQLAGVEWSATGLAPPEGRGFTDILRSQEGGVIDPRRDHVLVGRERTDVGRPGDAGYPVRGILTDRYLYLRNYEPDRWPAGNPETGYLDCDGGPTKTVILEARRRNPDDPHWALCFGRRPEHELYALRDDPDCVRNLAQDPSMAAVRAALERRMHEALRRQEDPRVLGRGHVFDAYPYANPAHARFHERHVSGEKLNSGWVNPSDFEPAPIP